MILSVFNAVPVPSLHSIPAASPLQLVVSIRALPKNNVWRLHITGRGVWFDILPFARPLRDYDFPARREKMRTLLILSMIAVASATGCSGRNPCGGWRPGYYLFGAGRNPAPAAVPCCDPCADPCGGATIGAPIMSAPVMQAPCCQ
jgi:hypothetical protein